MRGAGILTGCRRCGDVCPVGEDYETLLKKWVDVIAEETPEKLARLGEIAAADQRPPAFKQQERWIGALETGG